MPTDEEIEQVARSICKQYGLDPDELVSRRVHDQPLERDGKLLLVHRNPATEQVLRWQSFAPRALDAIIDYRAVSTVLNKSDQS